MAKLPTPQMLVASRPAFPDKSWLDTKPEFMPGSFCYPAKKETMELLHMPNPHEWDPAAEDWNLPENWEKILCDAFADRLVGIHDEQNYVERHGDEPRREQVWDEADFVKRAFEEAGEQNCAVIVKTQKQALALYQKLRGVPGITFVDNENTTHIGRRMIIPSYLAKGLEFDRVVVLTDGFTQEDQKLLYICCTRALHQLTLIGTE